MIQTSGGEDDQTLDCLDQAAGGGGEDGDWVPHPEMVTDVFTKENVKTDQILDIMKNGRL